MSLMSCGMFVMYRVHASFTNSKMECGQSFSQRKYIGRIPICLEQGGKSTVQKIMEREYYESINYSVASDFVSLQNFSAKNISKSLDEKMKVFHRSIRIIVDRIHS